MFKTLYKYFIEEPRQRKDALKLKRTEEFRRRKEGYQSYQLGTSYLDNNDYTNAIVCFDKAIELNIIEAYAERGFTLEALNYNLEAIEDFNKAIIHSPQDANLYFMRASCKSSTMDFIGANEDFEMAVKLSKIESPLNKTRNEKITNQNLGWKSATHLYESYQKISSTDYEHYLSEEEMMKTNNFSSGIIQHSGKDNFKRRNENI